MFYNWRVRIFSKPWRTPFCGKIRGNSNFGLRIKITRWISPQNQIWAKKMWDTAPKEKCEDDQANLLPEMTSKGEKKKNDKNKSTTATNMSLTLTFLSRTKTRNITIIFQGDNHKRKRKLQKSRSPDKDNMAKKRIFCGKFEMGALVIFQVSLRIIFLFKYSFWVGCLLFGVLYTIYLILIWERCYSLAIE